MTSDEQTRILRGTAGENPQPAAALTIRDIGSLFALNTILAAATPLLMMLPSLRSTSPPGSIEDLRSKLIGMVNEFESVCKLNAISEFEQGIASYGICAVVDECIQMTPWGGTTNWARQSLLIHFHRDNWGGEKFFEILNRLAAERAKYPALLEFFYVCLALGFMGRFYLDGPSGRQSLLEMREKVYQFVRQGRPEVDRSLSPNWQGLQVARRTFRGFGLMGALITGLAVLLLALYAYYRMSLASQLDELNLEKLSLVKSQTTRTAAAPASKPRLSQLLASEIANRQLEVRDLQLESIVTLLGEQLFDSGSAEPSASAKLLLNRVTDALKAVEGKVVVTGHTDNVPLRTLRFASNWELSNERASNVARVVIKNLGDRTRVSYEGRADSEPVASNLTIEGRAKNRRVEIVLKAPDAAQ